jgi:UDP-2,4-diacetamido-2,4,6-trideoxy-beta-L-altropyranose hydrolase
MPSPLSRVTVLCDAAAATGLGHFVRSSALAAQLTADGADVHLLLPADSLPSAVDSARAAGWQVVVGEWDPGEVVARTGPAGVAVVDSYRVDGPWLAALHRRLAAAGAALAVIDDQGDREFSADLVLNQNVGAERFGYPGAGRVLAGPRYALLRPQFPAHRAAALASAEHLPDVPATVLVLFGGTDAGGMAGVAAQAAVQAFPDAEVRAVLPGGPATAPAGVTYLPPLEAIHEQMLAADLVVSAGGTTLWELCCLARPAAVIAVAGNQQPAYDVLAASGAILPAGREPVRDVAELADRLRTLVAPPGTLRKVARRAAAITDGHGCALVAGILTELSGTPASPVRVRPATQDDAVLLHTWRNDPVVRSLSRSTDPIPLDGHAAWLRAGLASPDRHLLVVEESGPAATPVATTRYDLLAGDSGSRARWEVSITVAPEMRGRGLGSATLQASDAWLSATEPDAREIEAWVRSSNAGSRRLFERNGYRAVGSGDPEMDCFVRPIGVPGEHSPG